MNFSWSFSRLSNYETCPKRHYHYDIARDIKEEESGPMLEGHTLHKAFELRVSEGKKLPLNLTRHEPWMQALINPPGEAQAEQKLALNVNFEPVGFFADDVWFRCVVDFTKIIDDNYALIIDYKSGKVTDDLTQLSLQAATVFHHLPSVERIKSALAFVNRDKVVTRNYYRSDLPIIWGDVLPRVKKLESAVENKSFPPKPSGLCVRYCGVTSCPYHGKGTR